MTHIHGQIESLKRIRATLDQEEINRFNAVADINNFLNNYEREFDLELEVPLLNITKALFVNDLRSFSFFRGRIRGQTTMFYRKFLIQTSRCYL